jgi:hypothetical protein
MDMLKHSSSKMGFRFISLPKHWRNDRLSKFDKCHLLQALIKIGELAEQQIVLFTDAYDVLVVGHMELLLDRFHSANLDIVFSAESDFWPPEGRNPLVREEFEKSASKWRYLNSGLFMGRVWALRMMLDECLSKDYRDDQAMIQDFYYGHLDDPTVKVGIDREPNMFVSLNNSQWDFNFSGHSVFKNGTRSALCVIHANGSKGNLLVLESVYQALYDEGFVNSALAHLPTLGGMFLNMSAENGKIVRRDNISSETIVVFETAQRQAVAFTLKHGCLTFQKDGRVSLGATRLQSWERLSLLPKLTSAHGLPINSYLETVTTENIVLDGIPLAVLPHIDLAKMINNYVDLTS